MSNPKRNNRFWTVKAEETAGGKIGHLYLYVIIASKTWMGDEVTPALFREDIASLGDIQQLVVHIFSDGGDYFAGNDIYALLKQEKAEIITYGEVIVASIATMPSLAGYKVYISRHAHVLIHNVIFLLQGNYNKLKMQYRIRPLVRCG